VAADAVPDTIEREMLLAHPVERVWAALTEPSHLAQWFGDSAVVELRPGGTARFTWGDDESLAIIDVVERARRLAFWWNSGVGDAVTPDNRTYVEFTLTPTDGGRRTLLRLVESGFAALAHGGKQHADNTEGWMSELAELQAHLDGAAQE
jgi:uncharacterized protein YndB with AHSA1/START domain